MCGTIISTRKLQKLLSKSNAAKLLAVRKLTQDDQRKKTAGVDGARKLTPAQRMKLSNKDLLKVKVKPTHRIWIPKQ
ncbi:MULTISPECIES: reverse transcriptase N-terminal domain-containing protein [Mucilaginibacter]|uniref:reverse transcriptase N-terminal domain-containing protein n=1 Tax=Mucilaginibacter TaxID=423349 RepID=UPI00025559FC